MTKRILFFITFISILSTAKATDRNFNITIHVNGIRDTIAILAYNYGEKKLIADTIQFDSKGKAVISGTKSYEDGIYLLAFPSFDLRSFDFIIRETNFELSTDTADFVGAMKVKGSQENQLFYDDVKMGIKVNKTIDSLNNIANNETLSDQVREQAEEERNKVSEEYIQKRLKSIEEKPHLLYNKVLNVLRDVPVSATPTDADGKPVENYGYQYFIHHYWDYVDFTDPALIRTPVLLPKINRFLDQMVIPHPDSLIVAVDVILEKALPTEETFKALLSEIFVKYARSNIMGQEAIYVHMIDKYYAQGKAPWTDQESLKKMLDRAEALRPTLIGKIAPDINVYNLSNQPINFYKAIEKNDYTILVFWNSECGHCKKEIPLLKKIWTDSLQSYNVGVFSVSTEIEKEHAQKFIEENGIEKIWTNGYDPTGRSNFRKLYDILSTPVVVILDKDKRIIGKKIAVKDIRYIIESHHEYLKSQASKTTSTGQ